MNEEYKKKLKARKENKYLLLVFIIIVTLSAILCLALSNKIKIPRLELYPALKGQIISK